MPRWPFRSTRHAPDTGTPHADPAIQLAAAVASLDEPWRSSLQLSFDQLAEADPLYAPTEFWQPGVRSLVADLGSRGLEQFKSWPSAAFFFYPRYSPTLSYALIDEVMPHLRAAAPRVPEAWFKHHLVGASEANRDLDIALAQLDTRHLPLDIEAHGESPIGTPPQWYRPFGADGPGYGKPYLNYLKIVAALSRHLDRPLRSVVEIGAGFGVLGEILAATDPTIQYVDIDIPPLATVADYYLCTCVPDVPRVRNLDIADGHTVVLEEGAPSACLSPWQLPAVTGRADLFVNAFSFQEMEPSVVTNYVEHIARLETEFVVSLNSRKGKPLSADNRVGVLEQVTSEFIASEFARQGYSALARLGRPHAPPQAELLILKRNTP